MNANFVHPSVCPLGGSRGERRSPRAGGGQEGEGAQPPPQPAGGSHQQWDPLRPGTEGGGHRVAVSLFYTAAQQTINNY